MKFRFRALPLVVAAGVTVAAPLAANAASFPTKPIKWVLGYGAGGASDTIARTIAQQLPKELGQRVLIENRRGASGIIAANYVSKASPDGYTWLLVSSGFLANIAMGRKMAFDPFKAFEAVTEVGIVPNIVVVNKHSKIHSIKGLIAAAKAAPGKLNFGSGGVGTGTHLATELFDKDAGIKMTHIPYKGTPPALTALMGGRIQVIFAGAPPALPLVRSGKIRALAVTSLKKSPVAPNLPPVSATVPGFDGVTWYALMVPAGTPKAIVSKINSAFKKVLSEKPLQKKLLKRGFETQTSTPAAAAKAIRQKVATYKMIIKEAHIHVH